MATIQELESFKLSDAVSFHEELNPQLWEDEKLDVEVRDQLLLIAEDFVEYLGISNLKVKDVTISGSNAAYSYTPHSDLDLHILVDFNDLPDNEVYQELFTAKKTLYNDAHDITVHGVPVELYVQDTNQVHTSLGEYSVVYDKWIRIPKKRRANFDEAATKAKYEKLGDLIELALKSKDSKRVNDTLALIKRYRKSGLEKAGEFGPENLAFKAVRKQGLIQKLYDLKSQLHGEKLSIEEMYSGPKMTSLRSDELKGSYTSKQQVIDHFVRSARKRGEDVNLAMRKGAAAWERGWRGPKPKQPKDMKRQNTDPTYNVGNVSLEEALNSPYPYEKKDDTYHFTTDKGIDYEVYFINQFDDWIEVIFEMITTDQYGDSWSHTGSSGAGDSFKVFGTVIKIVQDYVSKNSPNVIYFTAKEEDNSRVNLYKRLVSQVDKALPQYQAEPHEKWGSQNGDEIFVITKKKTKNKPKKKSNDNSLLEYRFQEVVHTNPSIATLKSLAKNNKYSAARFTITQDGTLKAADSEKFTHQDISPDYRNVVVRGYITHLSGNDYSFKGSGPYDGKYDTDHPIYRKFERAGLINGNKDQIPVTESNVTDIGEKIKNSLGLQQFHVFERGADVEVSSLIVGKENQGKGLGSKAMQQLIDYADSNNKRITLTPGTKDKTHGTTSRARLVQFYKSLGFKESKGRNLDYAIGAGKMYRDPKLASDPNKSKQLKEASGTLRSINQDDEGGNLEGYVVDTDQPQLFNYLESQGAASELAKKIAKKFKRIGIIRNMYVDEEYRNQGVGTDLVNGAIDDAFLSGAQAILLVSDEGERNEFDLTRWYQDFGFKKIGVAGSDPVMLMTNQLTEASGYIPSAKEKNDPRFKTALTVDVKPDSIKKNAKAFGFKTSRAGIPPQARADGKINENVSQKSGSGSQALVNDFLSTVTNQERRFYAIRDNCGPAASDMRNWLENTKGIKTKRVRGEFVADDIVSKKADFTPDMKKEFISAGLDWNSPEDRYNFIKNNPKYATEWKKIPHYWLTDKSGEIYDPTGYIQFINTGLATDLNKRRYIPESQARADGKITEALVVYAPDKKFATELEELQHICSTVKDFRARFKILESLGSKTLTENKQEFNDLCADVIRSLGSLSAKNLKVGNAYIPAQVAVHRNVVVFYDVKNNSPAHEPAEFGTLVKLDPNAALVRIGNTTYQYPFELSGANTMMMTVFLDTVEKYDQFRMMTELKFDQNLPLYKDSNDSPETNGKRRQ